MEVRFGDIIQLNTSRGVKWLSAPPGHTVNPSGNWVISGFIGADILAVKEGCTIRVPSSDVTVVGRYSLDTLLKQLSDDPDKIIHHSVDVVERISVETGWERNLIRRLLIQFNLPFKAENEIHMSRIMDFIKKRTQESENGEG